MGEKVGALLVVAAAVLLRWCVGYHSYSGQGKPPMYGDYEAQRHWQEITLNLPVGSWYTNSSDNDLLYWGLDYPPLTAYHSLLMAKVARVLDPRYVELHDSRGFESEEHKHFMRLSVILCDLIIYIPAVVYFFRKVAVQESGVHAERIDVFGFKRRDYVLATALLYPGIILIDHGHFQYNCASLGLFVAAVGAISRGFTGAASLLFVLALNYKQMELYHALPFFFYILGKNSPGRRKPMFACLRTLIWVSLIVILGFIVVWAPFATRWERFYDAVSRLFPFGRGLFEDKVANVWCAVNVIYKLRDGLTSLQLARICLAVTTAAVLPSSLDLYLRPAKEKFVVSLINSALAFYLFSFQVHEKSILLVAVPVVLYLHNDPLPCFWFLMISTFSMLPLLIKDGLFLAYVSLTALYAIAVCLMWPRDFAIPALGDWESTGRSRTKTHKEAANAQRRTRAKQSGKSRSATLDSRANRLLDKLGNLLGTELTTAKNAALWTTLKISSFHVSLIGAAVLSVLSVSLRPPEKYPDLFPLLVSIYSCAHFCAFFLYFNHKQICVLHSGKTKSH